MSAYIVASYDIDDRDVYSSYVPGVGPLLGKHGAEVLVADYDAEVLEGEKRSAVIVIRFATKEAALAWYNDPDYEPLKKLRIDASSKHSALLARQFVLPGK